MILGAEVAEAVLRPIGGDLSPVGPDGRSADDEDLSDAFRELKAERKSIVKAELLAHTADEEEDPPDLSGRWAALAETAISYISDGSKDLEIMTMIVEASVRTDGLRGLGAALELLRSFVEAFWDEGMYPPEDEEDKAAARFNPLSGLSGGGERDGAIILPLRRMPLVGSLSYSSKLAADAKFNTAQGVQNEDQREALVQAGEAALDELRSLAAGISVPTVRAALDVLEQAEKDWRATINFIVQRTKPLLPSGSSLTRDLEGMREWLAALFKDQLAATPDQAVATGGMNGNGAAAHGAVVAVGEASPIGYAATSASIAGRDQALRSVLAIADFFDKTEPLSPIGPALRDVHRRANLSFTELVAELLPESESREGFYLRLGIKPPAEE
jgi:type VI secretion system protein ImpA